MKPVIPLPVRQRLDEPAPAPNPNGETRRERHVRMLTDARDRLRARMAEIGLTVDGQRLAPVMCRLHGAPWKDCVACSRRTK